MQSTHDFCPDQPRRNQMYQSQRVAKFIYSEKATQFCKISILLLSHIVPVKSKVEIFQNCMAFSDCMNFKVSENLGAVMCAINNNHQYIQLPLT
jgi:hypothetical protein